MPRALKVGLRFPVTLSPAQRRILAESAPAFSDRLKLDEPNRRVIDFSVPELKTAKAKAATALKNARTGLERRALRNIYRATSLAIAVSQRLPAGQIAYQFKITLLESHPPIWRRIRVLECSLDKLHEHIQTAMGWTNSHLHHFRVDDQLYGDPELMQENVEEMGYMDSTTTRISDILPKNRKRFSFLYDYDFGNSWEHEVRFEGIARADSKLKYPFCLEGARACPPEDCGGIWGYADFLEAIQDPDHEEHQEMREWVGRRFNPEAFNPAKATKAMRTGVPDWRHMF